MKIFQTRILHLNLCLMITLLTGPDYSRSNREQKIRQHIYKTVYVGETVALNCNKTQYDDDLIWKINNSVIFSQDSNSNRTMRNLSSNRIHIDTADPRELTIDQIQASDAGNYSCYPAAIRWTLTVTENHIRPESFKQMPLYIIIIISCCGVIMICMIISITICIHRRWKNSKDSSQREAGQNFSQAPARGRIQTQTSQYIERYNSVYGQI
ncbi:uncharacterized protein LOC113109383 [Carassius auratus]|uniref:Uncharacterized protein LOC113109383 n=1 Tax=Carassius auratus TaxID=7957 RepID=A0A6P6Q5E1_CARAU|nr:uncharacterized protein LOC113109383 [Carassius auratus]XP_052422415.1 uncharacterized protein LOC127965597 [Carassius gibelio]XP_052422416.1 uncharacterized protein LOC127965597 [Carassius gibelio]